jgi:hypothetical protein
MTVISQGMGSGLVKPVSLSDIVDEEWSEYLMVNLKIRTSLVFDKMHSWHCKEGICASTMP